MTDKYMIIILTKKKMTTTQYYRGKITSNDLKLWGRARGTNLTTLLQQSQSNKNILVHSQT